MSVTATKLKLEGRLDTAAVAFVEVEFAARAGALAKVGDKAVIDLSDLTYISSMGIRLLVTTIKQFRRRGVTFVTIRPHEPIVVELLQVSSLMDHLNLVDDATAASAVLGAAS